MYCAICYDSYCKTRNPVTINIDLTDQTRICHVDMRLCWVLNLGTIYRSTAPLGDGPFEGLSLDSGSITQVL